MTETTEHIVVIEKLAYMMLSSFQPLHTQPPSPHGSQSAVENEGVRRRLDAWALHRGAWSCREAL
jgi:hypothetical protein